MFNFPDTDCLYQKNSMNTRQFSCDEKLIWLDYNPTFRYVSFPRYGLSILEKQHEHSTFSCEEKLIPLDYNPTFTIIALIFSSLTFTIMCLSRELSPSHSIQSPKKAQTTKVVIHERYKGATYFNAGNPLSSTLAC